MTQKKGKQDKKKIRYPPAHIHAQWHGIRPDETLSLHRHEQNRIMCSVK